MANTVAPPAVAIGHLFNVGLDSGYRPENICCAVHAGLRGNRAARKHERSTASRTDQKLRLHLDTSWLRKNAIAESAFQGDTGDSRPVDAALAGDSPDL